MSAAPPIPVTCARRPTVGGLVIPWINTVLADGTVDFRMPRRARYTQCLDRFLCQTCGNRLPPTCVVFGGPNQLHANRFDEPPLCPPCALYASRACPMVAGRRDRYATQPSVSEGHRGKPCPEPGCQCGGYDRAISEQLDGGARAAGGAPNHAWYALRVRTGAWNITAHLADIRCSDGGCNRLHRVQVYNGVQLSEPPRKVMLVAEPAWERLDAARVAELCPWTVTT